MRDGGKPVSSQQRLFGTDGVRGVANVEPMTPETMVRLGRAVAAVCARSAPGRRRIVVGTDTRLSASMLQNALSAGICSAGVDTLNAGVLPTPGVAFLTRSMQAAAGAVVSASHNPFQDNGVKLFAADGFKVPDETEHEIEQLLRADGSALLRPTADELGQNHRLDDATARYADFLCQPERQDLRLDGVKIVVDCAHGAAYRVGPQVFSTLGAEVTALGISPDGQNINRDCGALFPAQLQDAVVKRQAHIGIALDGDADRLIVVDEKGEVVDGDEVLAIAAQDMMQRGTLNHAAVVATVMSNIGLEIALRDQGVRLLRVQVGDRYVVEEMRRGGYNLGGEQSGHLVFLDRSTTGDGLLAALTVVRLVVEGQRPLSELKRIMNKFPQVLRNVHVARRQDLSGVAPVQAVLERITRELHDRGRVLVRYSGTEPLVRVMVEGEDPVRVAAYAEQIAEVIEAQLGAGKEPETRD